MQQIKQAVWDRMKSLIQTDDRKPNYLVQLRNDEGVWVDIPREYVSKIDIDNRLDFNASECNITFANEDGKFTETKSSFMELWRTIFKDPFDTDTMLNYSLVEKFRWASDTNSSYDINGIKNTGFNGFATARGYNNGAISKLELTFDSKSRARFNFDFRKKSSGSIQDGEVIFYDDFEKGLKPQYQFQHDDDADNWGIRNYTPFGGKHMMSSGYIYRQYRYSDLILPVTLPCRCILEYQHRIFTPSSNDGWAFRRHRLTVDGYVPAVPPAPVRIPEWNQIDAVSGGIEFLGNHSGKGSKFERHQHILEPGDRNIKFSTWYQDGRVLSRWEMNYIKIFAYGQGNSGGNLFELLVDDVVVKTWGTEEEFLDWTKGNADWFYVENPGRHKIMFRVTHNGYSLNDYVDIDNILVQEYNEGDSMGLKEYYGYLVVPNVYVRVWLGYGDLKEDLILRFTGMIDRVVDGARGTIDIKCRDMMKKLIETMVRPRLGEYSIAYPENPMDDKWWVLSDVMADLINRAGCNAIVERTMVMENGVEVPYLLPAMKIQEGKPYIDPLKEFADGINYRCWANRHGDICMAQHRFKGQSDTADFELSEYVDLTDLEKVLDDASARGKIRVVCTTNNQAEEYMDEYLHYEVCKGEDRYASIESQWMDTPEKRQIMAQYMFRQMKRKFKTLSVGTVGNPFVDVTDHINVLETVVSVNPSKYTIVGIRTSVSDRGYIDMYDLEYGSDLSKAILVSYAWGDSQKEVGDNTDTELITWFELQQRLKGGGNAEWEWN